MGDKGGAEIFIHDYQKTGALQFFSDLNGVPVDTQPRMIVQHEHQQVVKRFIDAITLGTPMTPSGEEGVDRARIIDSIYESAALGPRDHHRSAGSDRPSDGRSRLGRDINDAARYRLERISAREGEPEGRGDLPGGHAHCDRRPDSRKESDFEVRTATLDEPSHGSDSRRCSPQPTS